MQRRRCRATNKNIGSIDGHLLTYGSNSGGSKWQAPFPKQFWRRGCDDTVVTGGGPLALPPPPAIRTGGGAVAQSKAGERASDCGNPADASAVARCGYAS